MEEYLQSLLSIPMYRSHHSIMNFLEISPLSFVTDLGSKGKEMLVKKRAGGFRRATCFTRIENFFTDITGHWRRRWIIIKDSCVIYMRPKDGQIRAVMLMDQGWNCCYGTSQLGVHHGIKISNLSRDLIIKCWTKRKARELNEFLVQTGRTSACGFTRANRFDSFAPERSGTLCQWFVDGQTYFEAISLALERAKEEIYITDWWLSPEIYMQRPVIYGDKWRLDSILKRKASQVILI